MRKKWLQRLALVVGSLILTFGAVELYIRSNGTTDPNGQFYFMERQLRPYRLLTSSMGQAANEYLTQQDRVRFLFDQTLGWVFYPNRTTDIFTINSASMRADQEYSLTPPPDKLRIALFGDSFIAGDEVVYENTIGYFLESDLQARGLNAEVLNFGVNGYGMDQAYLRWKNQGREYAPDIVIFGFNPENMNRNLNILPVYLRQFAAPFSKPRFVLEGDQLRLLNTPTISPADLVDVYANFATNPLSRYEVFFGADYTEEWWEQSRFLALIDSYIRSPEAEVDPLSVERFREGSEFTTLAEAIVDAFAADVSAEDEIFFVLHLPHPAALYLFITDQSVPYAYLLDRFAERYHVIRTEEAFPSWDDNYRMPGFHYSPAGATIIASKMADDIEACLSSGSCAPTRFQSPDEYRLSDAGDA